MKLKLLVLLSSLVMICGCVINPSNPAQFRKAAAGKSLFFTKDSLVVDRSLDEIEKILKKNVDKCMNGKVVITKHSMSDNGSGNVTTYNTRENECKINYKYDLNRSKDKIELYIRNTFEEDAITIGGKVDGGSYIMIVDATSAGKKQSNMDIYYIKRRGLLAQTIKDWMNGKLEVCPDLYDYL